MSEPEPQPCPICEGGTKKLLDPASGKPETCPICLGSGETTKPFRIENGQIIFEGLNLENPDLQQESSDDREPWQLDPDWWKA